jgi:hypothetical protein
MPRPGMIIYVPAWRGEKKKVGDSSWRGERSSSADLWR